MGCTASVTGRHAIHPEHGPDSDGSQVNQLEEIVFDPENLTPVHKRRVASLELNMQAARAFRSSLTHPSESGTAQSKSAAPSMTGHSVPQHLFLQHNPDQDLGCNSCPMSSANNILNDHVQDSGWVPMALLPQVAAELGVQGAASDPFPCRSVPGNNNFLGGLNLTSNNGSNPNLAHILNAPSSRNSNPSPAYRSTRITDGFSLVKPRSGDGTLTLTPSHKLIAI